MIEESPEPIGPPAKVATNENQLASVAELPKRKKYAMYETITEDHLGPYLNISCYPITVTAENDMVRSMYCKCIRVHFCLTHHICVLAGIGVRYIDLG